MDGDVLPQRGTPAILVGIRDRVEVRIRIRSRCAGCSFRDGSGAAEGIIDQVRLNAVGIELLNGQAGGEVTIRRTCLLLGPTERDRCLRQTETGKPADVMFSPGPRRVA